MAQIKLKKLWETQESLGKLLACNISIKKAFQAKKMGKQIFAELKLCNEVRNSIIESLGVDNGQGGYTVPSATDEDCEKYGWNMVTAISANEKLKAKISELLDTEVSIDIVKITMDELEEGNNKIAIADLMLLEDFIDG